MQSELNYINRQHKELFSEFEKWKPLFKDVRDFGYPYLGYFEDETPNSGKRPDDEMLRTMPIKYAQILAAGLQWGITSPTRPWVKFAFNNQEIMNNSAVLQWLDAIKDITLNVLFRGGFYPENHKFYLELGVFNTAAMLIEEDKETVINCRTFTIGEFAIGLDSKGNPNSFARNIQMTPFQIVEKFGFDNVPVVVQNAYKDENYNKFMKVRHLICPNKQYNENKIDTRSMKFADYYWMDGCNEGKYLRKSGYNEFPVMVERYQVKGADIYGTGPGIWSLGDAKQIQVMWADMLTAVELGIKPAVQAPSDIMNNGGINLLPAGANYYNPMSGQDSTIKPLFQVNLNLDHATQMQQAIEECIKEHFNVKVFQLLSDMEKGTRTAREVIELSSERMSQMGPLLERLQTGYLPQVIERIMNICFRKKIYPEPPPEIQGMVLDVQYVSVLSQAQQQYAITPIIDTVTNVIQIANNTQLPEILDKINFDNVTDHLSILNGIPQDIVKSDEEVAAIRQARAEQQAQMNAVQMGMTAAQGAKTLASADTGGDNALTQLLGGPAGGLQQ